jgi:hypothetical protein
MWGDLHWRRQHTRSWDLLRNIFDQQNHELAAAQSDPFWDIGGLWTAPATGRYLIQVRTLGIALGYTLRVEETPLDENPPVVLHGEESMAIDFASADQSAHLRLIGEAGKKYRFAFPAGKVELSANQMYLADDDSGDWGWDDEEGVLWWDVDRDSSLDVEIFAHQPINWRAYLQDLSIAPAQKPTEQPTEEEPTPIRAAGEKELADESDVRAFFFSAEAGKTYVFQTTLGSLEDSTLTLYDSDMQVVDDNDDVSDDDLSSMIEWKAEKSGIYYLVVGGFGEGSFEVSAAEVTGANRNELKLEPLAVEDARLQFAGETSSDAGDEEENEDGWLSSDDEDLDFSEDWDWGNL